MAEGFQDDGQAGSATPVVSRQPQSPQTSANALRTAVNRRVFTAVRRIGGHILAAFQQNLRGLEGRLSASLALTAVWAWMVWVAAAAHGR